MKHIYSIDQLSAETRALLGLSRRAFLGTSLAVAGLAVTPDAGQAEAYASPKQGGRLRIAVRNGAQTDTLDPATWTGSFHGIAFTGGIFNNLVEILPDGSIVGDLAESWESNDDFSIWTFRLRPGVSFHDGAKLTPIDVVESLRYHTGSESVSGARAVVKEFSSITAEGDDAVKIVLAQSNSELPALLSDYHLSIFRAKEGGGIDIEIGIGTGPYKLVAFEPGAFVSLSRNPDYHKAGMPHFDEVEVISIFDPAARLNALLTGEVDVVESIDALNIPLIESTPGFEISSTPSLQHFTFEMNCQVAPYDNPAVRLALKHAINRDEIINKIFMGRAIKGSDNPVSPVMPQHVETLPEHDYNPELAKKILDDAGIKELTVDLSVAQAAFSGAVEAAVLFKEQASKAGIKINVITEAEDGYWEQVWLKKPFVASTSFGRIALDWLFTMSYTSDAPWPTTRFDNAEFDRLRAASKEERDPAKIQEIYGKMQQLLHDEGGVIIVAFANYVNAMNSDIGHTNMGGMLPADNYRCLERWWRKSA